MHITHRLRRAIHPLLLTAMKSQQVLHVKQLNDKPAVSGNAIYACNHQRKYDAPTAFEVINDHTWVLAGIQRLTLVDRVCLTLNGTIWVDRQSKKDRGHSRVKMLEILEGGNNLLIFPEGAWNLTPNKPVMKLYWGIIDLARATQRPIIPLVLEYDGADVYVKFGEPISVNQSDENAEKIDELEDSMVSMLWDIWDMFPLTARGSLSGNEWADILSRRKQEYPLVDLEFERGFELLK